MFSHHGAADLAGSLLSAPVTVSAGDVEARTLLTAAGLILCGRSGRDHSCVVAAAGRPGFILRGRAGGARKFPRALAYSPDLDFVILHTFVRREAGMMD